MTKYLAVLLLFCSNLAVADLKLYVFECGHLSFDDITRFGLSNDDTSVRQLFVPCYLIEHEAGRL